MAPFRHLQRAAGALLLICSCFKAYSQSGSKNAYIHPGRPLLTGISADSLQWEEPWQDHVFFQQGLNLGFLLLGHGSEISRSGIKDLSLLLCYSPKLAYQLNDFSSVCIGTHLQGFYDAKAGYGLTLPLTIGGSIGEGAIKENENEDDDYESEFDIGGFFNLGLAQSFRIDDEDYTMSRFMGTYVDGGLRISGVEVRLSLFRAFKKANNSFALGLGFGYHF